MTSVGYDSLLSSSSPRLHPLLLQSLPLVKMRNLQFHLMFLRNQVLARNFELGNAFVGSSFQDTFLLLQSFGLALRFLTARKSVDQLV
jgi:hypothetical protein